MGNTQPTPFPPTPLITLSYNRQHLDTIPDIPEGIQKLDISFNNLKKLPKLPDSLLYLNASHNHRLDEIPEEWPPNIISINLDSNRLKKLGKNFPPSLKQLLCRHNRFTKTPRLPCSIKKKSRRI